MIVIWSKKTASIFLYHYPYSISEENDVRDLALGSLLLIRYLRVFMYTQNKNH